MKGVQAVLTNEKRRRHIKARVLGHLVMVRSQCQNHRVVQAADGASYAITTVPVVWIIPVFTTLWMYSEMLFLGWFFYGILLVKK